MAQNLTDKNKALIRAGIRGKYSQVAASGTACCFQYPTGEEGIRQQKYPLEIILTFPRAILDSFCGVGNPFSLGPVHPGEAVLDIGCGNGLDAFVAAALTGPEGRVVGLDVTEEMVEKARANLSLMNFQNVSFQVGEAEALPFPNNEFDVVISNGVFNLTLDKEKALREACRVLKPGGRLMLADMVLVQELPSEVAGRPENWYQWIGGAIPGKDFLALMLNVGFHRAGLARYTGFKSSPYTEGALFYGEKLVDVKDREIISAQAEKLEEPKIVECAPGSAWAPK